MTEGAEGQHLDQVMLSPSEVGARAYNITEQLKAKLSGLPEFQQEPDFFDPREDPTTQASKKIRFTLNDTPYSILFNAGPINNGTQQFTRLEIYTKTPDDSEKITPFMHLKSIHEGDIGSEIFTDGDLQIMEEEGEGTRSLYDADASERIPQAFPDFELI